MPGIGYDTTELINTLVDRGLIPAGQQVYTTASFLRVATQVMWEQIVPEILALRQDFFEWTEDVVITQNRVRIPIGAMGGKLENVSLLDGQIEKPMTLIDQNRTGYLFSPLASGIPTYYYIENQDIVLGPTPGQQYTLRLTYMLRPNKLVPTSECMLIDTVVVGATQTTLSSFAATSFVIGQTVDVVAGQPGFQTLAKSVYPVGGSSPFPTSYVFNNTQLNLNSKLPAVGDYLCKTGESCIPQIPPELHSTLAMLSLSEILTGVGDLQKANLVRAKAEATMKRAMVILFPRVNHSPKKSVNRNYFPGRALRRR